MSKGKRKKGYLKPIEEEVGQDGRSLITSCLENDENAWNLLLNFALPPLRYKLRFWVKSIQGCEADVDDIYQDFTFRLFKDDFAVLRRFLDSDKNLQQWLYNGLRYEYLTWFSANKDRKDKFRELKNYLGTTYISDEVFELLPDLMAQFHDSLTPREKLYMELYFDDNLDDAAIAQRMKITKNGVRTKRFRIKEKFKEFLVANLIF